MNEALLVSNVFLWIAVLALIAVVVALGRQVNALYDQLSPMGALMLDQGPKVGEAAPGLVLDTLDGGRLDVGGARGRSQLLLFISPTCPVCKKLLPFVKYLHGAEKDWLDVALASDGPAARHKALQAKAELQGIPYALSAELGMAYRVSKLPYAVLIGEDGLIRGKGVVNSREQLDVVLAARGDAAPEALVQGA